MPIIAKFTDSYWFGQKDRLGCTFKDADGSTFTISSATITVVKASDSTVIRNAVSCTVSTANCYYIEQFSAANGYAADTRYYASIVAQITAGSEAYIGKFEGEFTVVGSITT